MVKKNRGRPSKYKPEYCGLLVDHLKQGFSFESFSSRIPDMKVNRDTLYHWCDLYPDFSDAKKKGIDCSLKYWEQVSIDQCHGKFNFMSATTFIFTMKNRFGWRDVKEDKEKDNGKSNSIKIDVDDSAL